MLRKHDRLAHASPTASALIFAGDGSWHDTGVSGAVARTAHLYFFDDLVIAVAGGLA